MSLKGKKTRRAFTLAASSALLIALSSCSGSSNNYGQLTDYIYAQSGEYTVTEKELWDELKWDSEGVLETEINNVVLNKYINNINLVLNSDYSSLSDTNKTDLNVTTEDDFNDLKTKYQDRLVDYVIQDIYNFNFKNETYEENYKLITEETRKKYEYSYVDEMYSNYKIEKVGDFELDGIKGLNPYKSKDTYLKIANDEVLRQVYYPLYARELLALAKKNETVKEADDADTDSDDDMWGYYSTSNYVSAFKKKYINTYNLNAIMIKFTNDEEFTNTLRAFGVKLYNSKYYYIMDEKAGMSYQEYIEYYDNLPNTSLNAEHNVTAISDEAVLELYVQLYNYTYGGFRELLSTNNSNYDIKSYDLNTLRTLTKKIIDDYGMNDDYYSKGVKYLIESYGQEDRKDENTKVIYTAKEIEKLSTSMKTLMYETLNDTKAYSTSTTSANSGSYIVFKLGEDIDTATNVDYEQFYIDNKKDITDYKILDFITETDGLKDELEQYLIYQDLSDTSISSSLTSALEDVKVKIYNEACEISYSISNTNYSKTIGSNKDKNVLAVIEYDDTKYNLNIKANSDDENSLKVVGTDKPFGVYDYLESKEGANTAIDIISKKIVKRTTAYEDTNKDRADYEKYLNVMLLNFQNDGYSSSGYSSTIGKYNFLMMYFHTADIDKIIDDYYRVQYASSKLLTNYSSDDLAEFLSYYTDIAYDNYFSLSATKLLVYFDGDDDSEADKTEKWKNNVIKNWEKLDGTVSDVTLEYVAKELVYVIYSKISSSTEGHSDKLTSIVEEFNKTAKFKYEENPILSENIWSKYRHLGLIVKTDSITVTNSSLDVDFNIKSRLYDYARGNNGLKPEDPNYKKYEYFINGEAPTYYMEMLDENAISTTNNDIVETTDGYNLLLVTSGNSNPSAKWEEKDDEVKILTDIVIKYNEKYSVIDNIYNNDDELNINQIKLYLLDYIVNGSNTLAPSAIADAISTFLEPTVSRYTSNETQRIILLDFIKEKTGQTCDIYDVISYTKDGYNGENGVVDKIIKINQNIADSYVFIYDDITKTSDLYPDWWENVKTIVSKFLQKEGE